MNEQPLTSDLSPDPQALVARLARCAPAGISATDRRTTLRQLQRELRAARWDRRLGRMAATLLMVGVGLSSIVFRFYPIGSTGASSRPTPQAIGELAATVAEVTDLATAKQFARQHAAFQGWSTQGKEMQTIQRSFQPLQTPITPSGKAG